MGVHYKLNTMALCSSTKSGKLIDRIIAKIGNVEVLKTNLYNVEYYPKSKEERVQLAHEWNFANSTTHSDIIVLLGAEVHNNYIPTEGKVIKIAHPASKRSHKEMDEYVEKSASLINKVK